MGRKGLETSTHARKNAETRLKCKPVPLGLALRLTVLMPVPTRLLAPVNVQVLCIHVSVDVSVGSMLCETLALEDGVIDLLRLAVPLAVNEGVPEIFIVWVFVCIRVTLSAQVHVIEILRLREAVAHRATDPEGVSLGPSVVLEVQDQLLLEVRTSETVWVPVEVPFSRNRARSQLRL